MQRRPRRNRKTDGIRSMVQETALRPQDLIQPLFIKEGATTAVESMPGVSRHA